MRRVRGVEIPGEFDVLAGAITSPDYRRRAKGALAGVEVDWSTDAAEAVWNLALALEESDVPDRAVCARWLKRHVKKDGARRGALGLVERALSRGTRAAGLALDDIVQTLREQRIRTGVEQAVGALRRGDVTAAMAAVQGVEDVEMGSAGVETGDWMSGLPDRIRSRLAGTGPVGIPMPCGMPTLDAALAGGIRPQQVGVILAGTNGGKSVMGVNVVYTAAQQGLRAALFGTEMSHYAYATRLDARHLRIAHDQLQLPGVTTVAKKSAKGAKASRHLRGLIEILSYPPLTLTTREVDRVLAEAAAEGRPYDVVVIDSPDHMRCEDRSVREPHRQQAMIWWKLKAVATIRRPGMWLTTQARRSTQPGGFRIDGCRILLPEDIADSYDKARIASFLVSINATPEMREAGVAIGYLGKSRSGKAHVPWWLETEYDYMDLSECPPPDED